MDGPENFRLKSESKEPKDQKLEDFLVRKWMRKIVKIGRSFRDKMDGSPEDLQLKVGGLDFLFTVRKTFYFL